MRVSARRCAHRQPAELQRRLGLVGRVALITSLLLAGPLAVAAQAAAPAPVALGAASNFLVLAGTGGISNTGPTVISGDAGAGVGDTIAGLPSTAVGGALHAGDAQAVAAQQDAQTGYADAAGRASTGVLPPAPDGMTLLAGVYRAPDAVNLTGTVTLDGNNDNDSLFVLQLPAALNTAAASMVQLVNGAQASHVFWQVNGAVTLGANSTFAGTLIAAGAITIGDGTRLAGRALSTGTVTMSSNTITFGTAAPPLLTITGSASTFTLKHTPSITGTVQPATSSVQVTMGGQTLTSAVDERGGWSVTPTSLPNNRYPVHAVTTDVDGNQASALQMLTIGNWTPIVPLGAASNFLLLGGSGVANTSVTSVSGNVGAGPNAKITGFSRRYVGGGIHAGDALAVQALTDLQTAYADAAGRTPSDPAFAGDLNGRTFTAGVYPSVTAISLTGVLTLDGQNDPNSVFIFQLGAALTAAAASSVNLVNGAQASHVFWQIKGAATIGASAVFAGDILASGAITIGAAAVFHGAAFTPGVITLSGNTLTFSDGPPPTVTITGGAKVFTIQPRASISGTLAATTHTVLVTVNNQVLIGTAGADGRWSVRPAFLTNGRYDVVALVIDEAGNQGSAAQSLTIGNFTPPVNLGSTGTFSAFGGAGVANTGASSFDRNIGAAPGTPVSGVNSDSSTGATGSTALNDLQTAYDNAASRVATDTFAGDQNGQTFVAGVRATDAAFGLTGVLTLDGQGDANSVFIVQVHGALTTAAASVVRLVNGAQAGNVFWQVSDAATLGANSTFVGNLLAIGAITVGDGTQLIGRALAQGALTMANNKITVPEVVVVPEPVDEPDPVPTPTATPTPSTNPDPGMLSITVPTGSIELGGLTNDLFEGSIEGSLGAINVTDTRRHLDSPTWTASVAISAFTDSAGVEISPNAIGYEVGPVANGSGGGATYLRSDLWSQRDRSKSHAAVTASNISGINSATWDPTITVFIPSTALAGRYTATVTHSVS